ncbi:NAD+ synthase, partial [Halomonas sp. GDM18]
SRLEEARAQMAKKVAPGVIVIVGYPGMRDGKRYNLAGVLKDGEWIAEYAKQALPNYQVFDEQRYFTPVSEPCVVECRGARLGIVICEDLWDGAPIRQARDG